MDELEFRIVETSDAPTRRWQLQVLLKRSGVVIDESILLDAIQMIALKQCLENWAEENA